MSFVSRKRGGPRSETTSSWIVEELRGEIVSRRIAAGDRLVVSDLAARFGVSGAPVREALVQLSAEGYIDMQPNRGAVARTFDPEQLRQVFGLREALKSHQTRRFCATATPAAIAQLERHAESFAEAVAAGSMRRSSTANRKFHAVIVEHDGNGELIRILERHNGVAMMMRHDFGRTEARALAAASEHLEILAAIRARDPGAAAAAAARHVDGTLRDILACHADLTARQAAGA